MSRTRTNNFFVGHLIHTSNRVLFAFLSYLFVIYLLSFVSDSVEHETGEDCQRFDDFYTTGEREAFGHAPAFNTPPPHGENSN